eukprot:scaffold8605_cov239-Pinguiococcus_pyrenoidosus.AAC.1
MDQEERVLSQRARHRGQRPLLRPQSGSREDTAGDFYAELQSSNGAEEMKMSDGCVREEVNVLEGRIGYVVEDWHERVAWGLVEADGEEILIGDPSKDEDSSEQQDIVEAAGSAEKKCYMGLLGEDLIYHVIRYLEADMYGVLACCSHEMHRIATSDNLFRELCMWTYTVQSQRGRMRVERWGGHWRSMFLLRPRVRVNGLYFQRVSYIKTPDRNMWYQGEPGEILECVYYRYLRFFASGVALYGISLQPPKVAAGMLEMPDESSNAVSKGDYVVLPGCRVVANFMAEFGRVELNMQVGNGERGHFTRLLLLRHLQYPFASQGGEARELPILANIFKFRRLPIRTKPKGVW